MTLEKFNHPQTQIGSEEWFEQKAKSHQFQKLRISNFFAQNAKSNGVLEN